MNWILAALAALAASLPVAAPASAEERINRFVSDVAIQPDGTLEVTETIDVVAENVRINRGIYRDFPTRYRGRHGNRIRVGFTLLGTERDGVPEPSKVEPIANGVRIRIGDPDRRLTPGEHSYVIRYRTTRQLGRFDGYDELYWNATGNGWEFPIERARARIRLPVAAAFGQRAAYTGAQGSAARDAMVVEEKPGEIIFEATRPLAPREGLTVAVAFPKGIVAEEGSTAWWLSDYGPLAVGGFSLLGLAAYLYFAWRRAGRDPRPGTVVPLFAPPDELTPAAMRYVWKMKADNRAFAAALVDLGVRGHIRLVEEDGGFLSSDKVRLERLECPVSLPVAEEAMLRELATSGSSIVMEQKNHAKFSAAQKALSGDFKSRFDGVMFNRNWGWAVAGLALFAAALWLTSAAVVAATGTVDLIHVLVAVGALLTTALLSMLIQSASSTGKCLLVLLVFLFGGLALATGVPIVGAAFASGWWEPLVLPLLGLPLVLSAFFWIAAPTREGRKLLDRIFGFRQYLSIAEGERLDRMTAPEDTPELFERFLPYAIALGVENRWADRFSGLLAAAAAEGREGPSWYSGHGQPWTNPGRFVGAVGSSLASSVASASTAPGSSSGSGGGGSSGGGGGGGGGGGW